MMGRAPCGRVKLCSKSASRSALNQVLSGSEEPWRDVKTIDEVATLRLWVLVPVGPQLTEVQAAQRYCLIGVRMSVKLVPDSASDHCANPSILSR
jgi:hypothetical protein